MSDPLPGLTVYATVKWLQPVQTNMMFRAPMFSNNPFPCMLSSVSGDGGANAVLQVMLPPGAVPPVGTQFNLLVTVPGGVQVIGQGTVTVPPVSQ